MTKPVHPPYARNRNGCLSRLRTLLRCEGGVSAVEFALFAPILFFGLLATVDLGLALYQRMTIDHVLRAGGQSAMEDPREDHVENVMATIAERNFPADENGLAGLEPRAVRYFACPGKTGFADRDDSLTGTSVCEDDKHTLLFYHLSAAKSYDGLFVPITLGGYTLDFGLASAIQVQIR